jgi:hypothetical protein
MAQRQIGEVLGDVLGKYLEMHVETFLMRY